MNSTLFSSHQYILPGNSLLFSHKDSLRADTSSFPSYSSYPVAYPAYPAYSAPTAYTNFYSTAYPFSQPALLPPSFPVSFPVNPAAISDRNLKIILIAILALVSMDLIFIRPFKHNRPLSSHRQPVRLKVS